MLCTYRQFHFDEGLQGALAPLNPLIVASMFHLEDVSKQFKGVLALSRLTITFPANRTCVLLGTSGCGKSTLLRLMLGLTPPTTGAVQFDGRVLTPESVVSLRHKVGYVVQSGGLFPHLSAADNVTIVSRYLRWDVDRIEQRVTELAEMVQLPREVLTRTPNQLSGGQQQRVALMRALMLDPPALLLDEPFGALDPIVRHDLQEELKAIIQRLNKTVVMVTHDLNEAAYFADEIILLDKGAIVQRGSIRDLIDSPATEFVRRFVTAQRTLIPGAAS